MTTEFFAQTGNIAEASRLTQQCEAEVRDIVGGLVRRTGSTLSSWEGPASNAYRIAVEKWHTNATQILDALNAMSRALARSQENYDQTETSHVSDLEQFTYTL